MFDHLLESSDRDDSNKWSNIGFGVEIVQAVSKEVDFTHIKRCSACRSFSVNAFLPRTLHSVFKIIAHM